MGIFCTATSKLSTGGGRHQRMWSLGGILLRALDRRPGLPLHSITMAAGIGRQVVRSGERALIGAPTWVEGYVATPLPFTP